MLKESPWKGVIIFEKRGKLNTKYIRPFEIHARMGLVAYRLKLPQELNNVHDIYHLCNLKKWLSEDMSVIPLDEIQINLELNFIKEPVELIYKEVKWLKQSRIPIVKVWWNSKWESEYRCEREHQMKEK